MKFTQTLAILIAGFAGPQVGFGIYESDFAPTEAMPYQLEVFNSGSSTDEEWGYPPGWGESPLPSRNYPIVAWENAPERAPEVSNGYFLENRGEPSSERVPQEIRSNLIPDVPLANVEIRFDFKRGTNPVFNDGLNTGRVDLRLQTAKPGGGWDVRWLILSRGPDGEMRHPDVTGWRNDFQTLEISEPDANGWRTYTVTINPDDGLATRGDTIMWFETWRNPADPDYYSGTYGIDNVAMSIPFSVPVGAEIVTGTEVEFFGEAGIFYRVESSTDGQEWTVETDDILGSGETVRQLFSTHDDEQVREFRVLAGE